MSAEFIAAMTARGLTPPQHLDPGRLYRIPSNGKAGDTAGWCKLFSDGLGGTFGNWREGWTDTWQARRDRPMTAAERDAFQRQCREAQQQREAEERTRHADAAAEAAKLWNAITPAPTDHPYLVRKGVQPHGLRVHDGKLVVPIRNGNDLMSLQFIGTDGDKKFLTGGRVVGGYFSIGNPGGTVCIAEGFATAASIHEATGYAVAVAFDAGNLLPVAKALAEKFRDRKLIVAADDDAGKPVNTGMVKGRAAAEAVGAYLAVPDFGDNRPASATDFNDLARHAGTDAVRRCIEAATLCGPGAEPAGGADPDGWQDPQSLDRTVADPKPFPLDVLPGLIREAVTEYQGYGQQPMALVASSALAVVSLAAQGLADVARDERLTGPVSLNFLTIAQSGERKTAADKAFGSVLSEWERERKDAMQDDLASNRAALAAWTAEKEGIEQELKRVAKSEKDRAKVQELRDELERYERNKPAELVAPRLKYEDANPQSLAFHLAKGHPSAALWSDEGGMVTGSQGMGKEGFLGFLAMLNRLWDGGDIHHDRKQAESVHVGGRRFTVSLMVQQGVLREMSQRGGGLARGSGFLARYLIAAPVSTMGTGMYREPPTGSPRLEAFKRRIRTMLDSPLPVDDQGRLVPPVLSLSRQATDIWRDYHNEIERQLAPLGALRDVPDFASKSAENAARLAGCLHLFSGAQGAIGADTMQAAVTLARWYLFEALRVLDLLDEPQAMADARSLDAWLASRGDCSTRDAQQFGPVRDRGRRDAALEVLIDLDRVKVEAAGRRKLIVRNPALQGFATATPATVATDTAYIPSSVAGVATVAVANAEKLDGNDDFGGGL